MRYHIPKTVAAILQKLKEKGFDGYLVGGCVRDILLGREPKDWDVATDATPDEITKIFPESVYENDFGTVLVKLELPINPDQDVNQRGENIRENQRKRERESASIVEVTTFRLEGKYTDKRHPDEIKFARTIEEDLSRRDFTINSMALKLASSQQPAASSQLIDPFGGQDDLKNKIIRTVGQPEARFNEDALRLMRAARFAITLNDSAAASAQTQSGGQAPTASWQIDFETRRAMEKQAGLLEMIAKERVRDELVKILESPRAAAGIILLEESDLLRYVLPELREGLGMSQNLHHLYTVFEHNVKSLDYAAKKNYSLAIRLAALLHDLGKPRTKRGEGPNATFYNHEIVGTKMAIRALERLRFPKDLIEGVAHLVRYHMFYYNVGEVSPAGVRRFLARVGPEIVPDLIKVREADRIGSGVPKAVPYKLRHLLFMIEKVKHDPVSPKMLKVNGEDVMRILNIPPGPRVGQILSILLEEVIDEPEKNAKESLESRIEDLGKISDAELAKFSAKARDRKEEFQQGIELEMKKKHYVR